LPLAKAKAEVVDVGYFARTPHFEYYLPSKTL